MKNEEIIKEALEELFYIYQQELESTIKEHNLDPCSEIAADYMNQVEEHAWTQFTYLFPHYRPFLDEIAGKFYEQIYERYFEMTDMIKKKLKEV